LFQGKAEWVTVDLNWSGGQVKKTWKSFPHPDLIHTYFCPMQHVRFRPSKNCPQLPPKSWNEWLGCPDMEIILHIINVCRSGLWRQQSVQYRFPRGGFANVEGWKLHPLRSSYDVKGVFHLKCYFNSHLSQLDKFPLFTGKISRKSEIAFFNKICRGTITIHVNFT
jgi:hypothetical protein